jgi:hypothetical protein
VNPEVDSKMASINEGIEPLKRYGREPMTEKNNQDNVTAIYPSLLLACPIFDFSDIVLNTRCIRNVIRDDHMKGATGSLYKMQTGIQHRYEIVSIRRIVPRILRMISGFISFILCHGRFKVANICRINLFILAG